MKFFVIFALALAIVSAFDLRNGELKQRNVPVMETEGRITNGFKAFVGELPFQVGLNLTLFNNSSYWCGGSIISTTYVLTSAYCLVFTQSLIIYFGATKRTAPEKEVTVHWKNNFIIHEGFDINTFENNIGLIKFEPITYTNRIKDIGLPPDFISGDPTFVEQAGIVPGWGRTVENGNVVVEDLHYTVSKIISNDECAKSMENVYDTSICISTESGSSPCEGDQGGPLVLVSYRYVVGVFSSFSPHGCTKDYPAVFERVTSHLPWIREHTGIES